MDSISHTAVICACEGARVAARIWVRSAGWHKLSWKRAPSAIVPLSARQLAASADRLEPRAAEWPILCACTLHALLRIPRAVAFLENGRGKGAKFKKNFLMKLLGKKRLLAKRLEKRLLENASKLMLCFGIAPLLCALPSFGKWGERATINDNNLLGKPHSDGGDGRIGSPRPMGTCV